MQKSTQHLHLCLFPSQLGFRISACRWWKSGAFGSSPSSTVTYLKFCFKFIIYLFLAIQGLHCSAQAFSGCREWGLLSSCRAHASPCSVFSCCRAQALEPTGFNGCVLGMWWLSLGMWNLPEPGIKPTSPALAGELPTTGPPEKSSHYLLWADGSLGLFFHLFNRFWSSTYNVPSTVLHAGSPMVNKTGCSYLPELRV